MLIFFGYSWYPDACPTTLSKLSSVARRLGDDRSKIQALYVWVDPDRDTPPVLKADMENFSIGALRPHREEGGHRQGREAVPPRPTRSCPRRNQAAGNAPISHTTSVYALDTAGRVRKTFAYEATVDEVVTGIREILAQKS